MRLYRVVAKAQPRYSDVALTVMSWSSIHNFNSIILRRSAVVVAVMVLSCYLKNVDRVIVLLSMIS